MSGQRLSKERESRDHLGRRRVVITGLNAVGPGDMGLNLEDFWASMVAGRSGASFLQPIESFAECAVKVGGQVPIINTDGIMTPKERKRNHQVTHLSAFATHGALLRAKLLDDDNKIKYDTEADGDERYRFGVVVGSGVSGTPRIAVIQQLIDTRGEGRVGSLESLFILPERPNIALCGIWDIRGVNFLPVSACQTGGASIFIGTELIRSGRLKVAIAGGVENPLPIDSPLETHLSQSVFINLRAISPYDGRPYEGTAPDPTKVSRPFNAGREKEGFVMGAGAGILVLEDYEHAMRREAPIYAEVIGVSITNDGRHEGADTLMTGEGAKMSMRLAFQDANVSPQDNQLVVAHATSTGGDGIEAGAIKEVFGDKSNGYSVTAPKSEHTHTLGASGGMAAVIAIMAINYNIVPPTINFENSIDPDLDFTPNTAKERDVEIAETNALGFGGGNSSNVFAKVKRNRWI